MGTLKWVIGDYEQYLHLFPSSLYWMKWIELNYYNSRKGLRIDFYTIMHGGTGYKVQWT